MSHSSVTLHTTAVGQEDARIVFLHGLFGQGKNFTAVAKALSDEFTSLLVDLPNHGRSDWTGSVDYTEAADQIAAQLRADFAADGPVHLIGHSMGGKVAMVLALRHPDLIERLIIVDIAPVSSDDMSTFEHLLGSLARLDLTSLESRTEADEQLSAHVEDPVIRGFLLQNLRRQGGSWHWQANLDLLLDGLPEIGDFPEVEPGAFEGPVMWVAGEKSPYIKDEHGPAMRRLFPRTRLVTVNGAGHWVHSEQPDRFVATVRAFLNVSDAEAV